MPASGRIVNAMTVDVEDYFHVSAFDRIVSRDEWPHFESRVCGNTDRLLAMFDEARISATFFILGWVADRFPALVARIAACGHEIASHGFGHRLAYEQTPHAFREDVRRAKGVLEALTGRPVVGYRAPSYSVTERSLWALDVLIEEGHGYDSSILPIHHDRYGIPKAPRHTHTIVREAGAIVEIPGSTVACGPINLPVAGGGYFRILPYTWTKWGISHVNLHEGMPAVFYVHPWEIRSTATASSTGVAEPVPPLPQSRGDRNAASPADAGFCVRHDSDHARDPSRGRRPDGGRSSRAVLGLIERPAICPSALST